MHRRENLPRKPTHKIIQSLFTLVCDDKNFSPAGQPQESKCKVVDSSVLARQKTSDGSGGRQLIDTSGPPSCVKAPVTLPVISCCSVHTLNAPTPIPPILHASLLHGAPWPSCISMLYERWRGGKEGLGEVERQRRHRGRIGQCSEAWATVGINQVCRITAPLSCDQ